MFTLDTRVRHKRNPEVVGTVTGYGTLLNPWSGKTHPVYLVNLDASIREGRMEHENARQACLIVAGTLDGSHGF